MVKIVRIRDAGFTADFENARLASLTSSRTKSKFVKLLNDIFPFIYFLAFLKFYSKLDSRSNKREFASAGGDQSVLFLGKCTVFNCSTLSVLLYILPWYLAINLRC